MSRFYLGDSSSSRSGDSDDDTLPYPAPLQRSDFLAPEFDPSKYLSTLRNRHQTLEDLRLELRSRSQLLSKELLDLVNANYQDFLGLGRSLNSGDEKVEEVRVGLLGFRKEVEGLRGKVAEREEEVRMAVEERVGIRKQIAVGRALMDYEARLALLESRLMVEGSGAAVPANDDTSESEEDTDDEDEEEEGTYGMPIARLRGNAEQYRLIHEVSSRVGEQHPFITAQAPRMAKVRSTLLMDLNNALKEARSAGKAGASRIVKILGIYADLDETAEAVNVLKSSQSK
ncbi:hypothetical protein M011DRAFT_431593 [Sporormia fimetaria CBS 119925]|uniref:Conserved oligomeric Golgi complex subunit 2 n=1 Tax=Sporormia fimetaria CBS 119925 TaxID=1340428 RepID=A0A6A6UY61_9PLEO|nr:hypothetical protein M011DRAFT_431593 [Sporormia fimetaria CBS 119925]